MVTILLSAWLYSLFAKDYGMGGDDLSLETLVAPPVIEEAPPPEPEKQPEKQKDPNVDVRKEIIQSDERISEGSADKISVVKNRRSRRAIRTNIRSRATSNYSAANAPPPDYKGPVNTGGTGSDSGIARTAEEPARPAVEHHRHHRRQRESRPRQFPAACLTVRRPACRSRRIRRQPEPFAPAAPSASRC